jgi:hypothetical protein
MRKLSLDLDALTVETFETTGAEVAGGTIHARETFDSECQCDTDSCQCGSVESCTICGCDTPGFTCEERCWPQTEAQAAYGVA